MMDSIFRVVGLHELAQSTEPFCFLKPQWVSPLEPPEMTKSPESSNHRALRRATKPSSNVMMPKPNSDKVGTGVAGGGTMDCPLRTGQTIKYVR